MMNCAFCGSRPIASTNIKKNKSITACCNSDCPIFGVKIAVKEWEKQTISWDDGNLGDMEGFQKRYFPSKVGKIKYKTKRIVSLRILIYSYFLHVLE